MDLHCVTAHISTVFLMMWLSTWSTATPEGSTWSTAIPEGGVDNRNKQIGLIIDNK